MDNFSEAGFGNFVIRELHFSNGYARISCEDTFEAWALHYNGQSFDSTICFSTGALLSFTRRLSGKDGLVAGETRRVRRTMMSANSLAGLKNNSCKRESGSINAT